MAAIKKWCHKVIMRSLDVLFAVNQSKLQDEQSSWQWFYTMTRVWGHCNSWWRHQMETFSALLAICAGNSPVPGEFPTQRSVTRSFDVFFDLHPNKRLSKQSWGWWFETLSWSLWRHCNGCDIFRMEWWKRRWRGAIVVQWGQWLHLQYEELCFWQNVWPLHPGGSGCKTENAGTILYMRTSVMCGHYTQVGLVVRLTMQEPFCICAHR